MLNVVILAGGKSERMHQNKILMHYKNKPIIFYTIDIFKNVPSRIIVVTGKYDHEIRDALKDKNVEIITNKNYENGMFSSIQTGVSIVDDDFMIIPGDCPFVSPDTISKMMAGEGSIRIPRYNEKDGHPIYFKYVHKEGILNENVNSNLKKYRDSYKYEIINVDDPNVVINLNYFLDFATL